MNKTLKIIRNIILTILFVLYASVIIGVSTLVLNRNEFGYTRFGENDLIFINKDNASKEYKDGSLVITQMKLIDELKVGEKVFVYEANDQKQEVKVVYKKIIELVNNPSTKYIKLEDETAWGEEYIAGKGIKEIEKVGAILSALETKWLFFGALIVPVFFILIIEIYQFVVTIKYNEEDEEEDNSDVKEKEEEKEKNVDQPKVEEKQQVEEQPKVEENNKQEQPNNDINKNEISIEPVIKTNTNQEEKQQEEVL